MGTATNKTGKPLTGPYNVQVYCFTGNKLVELVGAFTDQHADIVADAKVSFTVPFYDTKCPNFTVGVSGYLQ